MKFLDWLKKKKGNHTSTVFYKTDEAKPTTIFKSSYTEKQRKEKLDRDLFQSVLTGEYLETDKLINQGADPKIPGLLHIAIAKYKEVMDQYDYEDSSPEVEFAKDRAYEEEGSNYWEILEILLKRGADIDTQLPDNGFLFNFIGYRNVDFLDGAFGKTALKYVTNQAKKHGSDACQELIDDLINDYDKTELVTHSKALSYSR